MTPGGNCGKQTRPCFQDKTMFFFSHWNILNRMAWLLERTLKELSKNHLNIENGRSLILFKQPYTCLKH
jgi:hypothetical protein